MKSITAISLYLLLITSWCCAVESEEKGQESAPFQHMRDYWWQGATKIEAAKLKSFVAYLNDKFREEVIDPDRVAAVVRIQSALSPGQYIVVISSYDSDPGAIPSNFRSIRLRAYDERFAHVERSEIELGGRDNVSICTTSELIDGTQVLLIKTYGSNTSYYLIPCRGKLGLLRLVDAHGVHSYVVPKSDKSTWRPPFLFADSEHVELAKLSVMEKIAYYMQATSKGTILDDKDILTKDAQSETAWLRDTARMAAGNK
jgi:hypothetical protein